MIHINCRRICNIRSRCQPKPIGYQKKYALNTKGFSKWVIAIPLNMIMIQFSRLVLLLCSANPQQKRKNRRKKEVEEATHHALQWHHV